VPTPAEHPRLPRLSGAALLALATVSSCLGALGQWTYGRLGWDVESALLARYGPPSPPVPLARVLALAAGLAVGGIPLSALLLHAVLRRMGAATGPLSVTYRLSAWSAVLAALLKLVPGVGYFLGLVGGLVVQYRAVRRLHRTRASQAALAIAVTAALLTVVLLGAGYLGHRLIGG
jgi:hypothetical protein